MRKEILGEILWKMNEDPEFRAEYMKDPRTALSNFINPALSAEEIEDFVKTVEMREDIRVKIGGPWFKACTA